MLNKKDFKKFLMESKATPFFMKSDILERICLDMKVVSDIQAKKYPVDKTIRLINIQVPGAAAEIAIIVEDSFANRKVNPDNLSEEEIESTLNMAASAWVSTWFINNAKYCKEFMLKSGKLQKI